MKNTRKKKFSARNFRAKTVEGISFKESKNSVTKQFKFHRRFRGRINQEQSKKQIVRSVYLINA